MIGVDVKIDGKIVSEQNLVIEGAVKGSITAKKAEVLVGKSGSLTANISAKVVRIEGTGNRGYLRWRKCDYCQYGQCAWQYRFAAG